MAPGKPLRLREASDCADKLRVLGEPIRLAVLEALMQGPRRVGELGRLLRVEQSLLSHHLKTLRGAGLVEAERDGKAVLYRLAPGVTLPRGDAGIELGCCRLSFEPPDAGRGKAAREK